MMQFIFWLRIRNALAILKLSLCFVFLADATASQVPVANIFLIQNSGWMEPFYVDPASRYKPLINEIIKRVWQPGDEVVVASFNESVGTNKSPLLHYHGSNDVSIAQAVNAVQLARKPGGSAYADTDFKEALVGSITQFTPGRPAILWVFTNNKNSPKNSSETAIKNKEFYTWLQNEPLIKSIVAYPYKMPVKGRHYQANGAMIYVLAYGDPADAELQRMIDANRPFGEKPARLKPLNAEAITFVPNGAKNQDGLTVALGQDHKTLILQFDGDSRPHIAELLGNFRNDFYPYDIQSARVGFGVRFKGDNQGVQADIHPTAIKKVAANGVSEDVKVRIAVPPLPSVWNPSIIFGSGHQVTGNLIFQLDEQQLTISSAFLQKMNELFPGDPLPDLFVPGESARSSLTTRPIVVVVNYPIWPLMLVAMAGLTLLVGSGYLMSAMLRPKKFMITVDGMQKTYALKAYSNVAVRNGHGEQVGLLKRGLGKPRVTLEPNIQSNIRIL